MRHTSIILVVAIGALLIGCDSTGIQTGNDGPIGEDPLTSDPTIGVVLPLVGFESFRTPVREQYIFTSLCKVRDGTKSIVTSTGFMHLQRDHSFHLFFFGDRVDSSGEMVPDHIVLSGSLVPDAQISTIETEQGRTWIALRSPKDGLSWDTIVISDVGPTNKGQLIGTSDTCQKLFFSSRDRNVLWDISGASTEATYRLSKINSGAKTFHLPHVYGNRYFRHSQDSLLVKLNSDGSFAAELWLHDTQVGNSWSNAEEGEYIVDGNVVVFNPNKAGSTYALIQGDSLTFYQHPFGFEPFPEGDLVFEHVK